ncbi:Uncharacterized protein APZ42_003941 [Daphnia magna]|uniref:Uncharacterized protein n=1 Tax=Daphnia magna TaxID=35525 RepID=A0A164HC92_9CRUS|nr:Uncharacterized protein APZ42_003941 [Daphnia magna]
MDSSIGKKSESFHQTAFYSRALPRDTKSRGREHTNVAKIY